MNILLKNRGFCDTFVMDLLEEYPDTLRMDVGHATAVKKIGSPHEQLPPIEVTVLIEDAREFDPERLRNICPDG